MASESNSPISENSVRATESDEQPQNFCSKHGTCFGMARGALLILPQSWAFLAVAQCLYQTTKGGVVNMTWALAIEWARQGIRVNAVAPTWVKTQFIASLTTRPELMAEIARVTPLGRLAEPDEIAAAVLFLASPAASMITGHILAVDGGFLAQ
jgi:NAD(P)-dependent dehydrogenase (short-subunit alcohol dehydrogenase family)